MDDYDRSVGVLPIGDQPKVLAISVLGIDASDFGGTPPPFECRINGQFSLTFSTTTPSRTAILDSGIIALLPGLNRRHTLVVDAYEPGNYPETQLADLLTGHITGSYFDPEHSGEGMLIEIANVSGSNVFALTWFTFDDNGNPFWLAGATPIEADQRQVELRLDARRGGGFAGAAGQTGVQVRPWGELALSISRCNTLEFTFRSTHSAADMPMGTGTRRWSRLTKIAQLGCD